MSLAFKSFILKHCFLGPICKFADFYPHSSIRYLQVSFGANCFSLSQDNYATVECCHFKSCFLYFLLCLYSLMEANNKLYFEIWP